MKINEQSSAPVIRLSRELALYHLLPVAFYELQIHYPLATTWRHAKEMDAFPVDEPDDRCLDIEDFKQLLEGREELAYARERLISDISDWLQFEGLADHEACREKLAEWWKGSGNIETLHSRRNTILMLREYELALARQTLFSR